MIEAAVWPEATTLYFRDMAAPESSYKVAEDGTGEETKAVTLANVLKDSKFPNIDILKIDIEGAESELFAKNISDWLPYTRNIGIELHTDDDRAVFFQAMSQFKYELVLSGETTICKNIQRK